MSKIAFMCLLFIGFLEAKSIEEFNDLLAIENKKLPVKIDDVTLLKSIKIINDKLVYDLSVNIEKSELRSVVDGDKKDKKKIIRAFKNQTAGIAMSGACKSKFIMDYNNDSRSTVFRYRVYKTDIEFSVLISKKNCEERKGAVESQVQNVEIEVKKVSEMLPIKIANGASLTVISYKNKTIYQKIVMNRQETVNLVKSVGKKTDLASIRSSLHKIENVVAIRTKNRICSSPMNRRYLELGIIYRFELEWDNDKKIDDFIVGLKECKK